jgi:hypothetical protein
VDAYANWLHDQPYTYASIDLELKRKAIARVKPIAGERKPSWRKNETVLEWLEKL